jgi:hypothetical protein
MTSPHTNTAPVAAATGRLFRRLATPALIMVALLIAAVHRPRECYNANGDPKIRHRSREDAIQHKRSLLLADDLRPGHTLKVYLCGVCGFWHVGNAGKRRRRGGRR